jgi:hypothetical protein
MFADIKMGVIIKLISFVFIVKASTMKINIFDKKNWKYNQSVAISKSLTLEGFIRLPTPVTSVSSVLIRNNQHSIRLNSEHSESSVFKQVQSSTLITLRIINESLENVKESESKVSIRSQLATVPKHSTSQSSFATR